MKVFGKPVSNPTWQKILQRRQPRKAVDQRISSRIRSGVKKSKQEAIAFADRCEAAGLPRPELEYQFHPVRGWRMDLAFPRQLIYIEIEGGVWIKGGHSSGAGIVKDIEKQRAAFELGWRLLRVLPKQLDTPETMAIIHAALTALPDGGGMQ